MLIALDTVMELWRSDSPEGNPSRKDANAFPLVVLEFVPFDEVVSLSNSKKPAPLPGAKKSRPILRKSAPTLMLCEPRTLVRLPFMLWEYQSRSVGLIAPRVWLAYVS